MFTVMTQQGNTLYADISRCIQKNDYRGVIKAVDEILYSNPDDIKVIQCKIVALEKLDRFEDALAEFGKFPHFTKQLNYEKAYALYRLNRFDEALRVVECSNDKNKIHYRELKAQICYQLDKFKESYELYKSLIKQTADEHDVERKVNLIANIANLVNLGEVIDIRTICPHVNSAESYEILYNTACCLMYLNKFDEVEAYLLEAEKQCLESFDEDTSAVEANIIKTQLSCCKQFQKKYSQASNFYKDLLDKKPDDVDVLAVCTNNSLGLNKNSNFFELKKKIKVLQSETMMSKLTSLQKRKICNNIYQLNALNASNIEEALKLCDKLKNEYPESLDKAALLKATILMKNKNLNEAITVLDDMESNAKPNLITALAKSQLYLNVNKFDKACDALELLGDDKFYPGIVSTLVTIKTGLGDTAGASEVLVSAGDWMKKNNKNTGELAALWEHASELHLKRGKLELAVHSLEELLKIKPHDRKIISKLVIAYAKTNPTKAQDFCKLIRSGLDLKPRVDVCQLESSSWMMGLKPIKHLIINDRSPGSSLKSKKSTSAKKRRKRLPKNYDPHVTPDPERWLPMRERSYFKKKKLRRNKEVGKGTQGGSPSAADQYDITKISSQTKDKNTSLPATDAHKVHHKIQRKKKKGDKR